MPAQDREIELLAGQWTKLTDGLITTPITWSVIAGPVLVRATFGAASEPVGVWGYPFPGFADGWSEATIGAKFPGVLGGGGEPADTLWGRPQRLFLASGRIAISHAAGA